MHMVLVSVGAAVSLDLVAREAVGEEGKGVALIDQQV